MDRRRKIFGVGLALAIVLAGALGPALAGADAGSVTIQGFAYGPTPITVTVGDTVTWTNQDSGVQHSATADDGSFDTGRLSTSKSASRTFSAAGTFTYYCSVHGHSMTGKVIVVPASTPTTTTPVPTTPAPPTTIPAAPTPTTTAPTTTPGTALPPTAKPRIGSASLSHPRFRIARRAHGRTAPLHTAFRFTLTADATVRIAIAHRAGHRTLLHRRLAKGRRSVAFGGRVGRKTLVPGRYVATITTSNAGGSATPVRLAFTIVR
jgi:plastocyanin